MQKGKEIVLEKNPPEKGTAKIQPGPRDGGAASTHPLRNPSQVRILWSRNVGNTTHHIFSFRFLMHFSK